MLCMWVWVWVCMHMRCVGVCFCVCIFTNEVELSLPDNTHCGGCTLHPVASWVGIENVQHCCYRVVKSLCVLCIQPLHPCCLEGRAIQRLAVVFNFKFLLPCLNSALLQCFVFTFTSSSQHSHFQYSVCYAHILWNSTVYRNGIRACFTGQTSNIPTLCGGWVWLEYVTLL